MPSWVFSRDERRNLLYPGTWTLDHFNDGVLTTHKGHGTIGMSLMVIHEQKGAVSLGG
jgi:hypothetical protein